MHARTCHCHCIALAARAAGLNAFTGNGAWPSHPIAECVRPSTATLEKKQADPHREFLMPSLKPRCCITAHRIGRHTDQARAGSEAGGSMSAACEGLQPVSAVGLGAGGGMEGCLMMDD